MLYYYITICFTENQLGNVGSLACPVSDNHFSEPRAVYTAIGVFTL
jgi:hypothetical protein